MNAWETDAIIVTAYFLIGLTFFAFGVQQYYRIKKRFFGKVKENNVRKSNQTKTTKPRHDRSNGDTNNNNHFRVGGVRDFDIWCDDDGIHIDINSPDIHSTSNRGGDSLHSGAHKSKLA